MIALLGIALALQAQTTPHPPTRASHAPLTATSVQATRAVTPPVIDGRDNDPVWRTAPPITQFQEARPKEGGKPRLPTEARIAYDAHDLYVFVRAFDPHPDSIVAQLSRRDDITSSDWFVLLLDSYHDRRTGYEFWVNPAGVKADAALYNDGNEDFAWDAVWDVATTRDSLGWTAEYRIPLSQVRFTPNGDDTFGILLWRVIQRYTETVTWPLYHSSKSGFVSQFGSLTGLKGLGSPTDAEITPYVVTKNVQGPPSNHFARAQKITAGGDLKYRLASNLLLNATVNPDFGQVEADPSVLNLGAFETFFSERRPFFVEGKGLFNFPVNCTAVDDCNTGEGLFYSRRIGREPELESVYGNASSATATPIIGAAKMTGRLPGGLNIGLLDAVTDHVGGPGGTTLEPATNYAVVRGQQTYDKGNGDFGFIVTGMNRGLDASASPYLHQSAYALGFDARRRFGGRFQVSGSFDLSRIAGSATSIAATQRSSVHLYQRPDGPLTFDSTRTALAGTDLELHVAKVGGKRLHFETDYQRRSPGFDVNDVGFLQQADQQQWSTWAALYFRTPNRVFQQLQWNFNNWEYWSAEGLPTERAFNTNTHIQFTNRWWLHLGGTLGQLGATYCDRCARGGPAIRQDPYIAPWGGIAGDDRHALVPYFWFNYFLGDGGHSSRINLSPELDLKVSSRFSTSLGASYTRNHNDTQYFGTFSDSAAALHYTFAHLEQKTLSLTWRLNFTFSPTASLQIYASPFVSKGTYSDVRELDHPRAASYDARYQAYGDTAVADHPGGFNVQQFRSNVVFRWEYRRGSTLFLVWSEGRDYTAGTEGSQSFNNDFRNLFDQRANDTFLIKMSYWLAR